MKLLNCFWPFVHKAKAVPRWLFLSSVAVVWLGGAFSVYAESSDGSNVVNELQSSDDARFTRKKGKSDDDQKSKGKSDDDQKSKGKSDDDQKSKAKSDDEQKSKDKSDDQKSKAKSDDEQKSKGKSDDDDHKSKAKSDDDHKSKAKSDDDDHKSKAKSDDDHKSKDDSKSDDDSKSGKSNKKVDVCHNPGTPAEQTLNIPMNAYENGHKQHGDTLAACPPPPLPPVIIDDTGTGSDGTGTDGSDNTGSDGTGTDNTNIPISAVTVLAEQGKETTLNACGELLLVVPGEALIEPTLLWCEEKEQVANVFDENTATIIEKETPSRYVLGPHGTIFSVPVTITLGYEPNTIAEGFSETDLTILHENIAIPSVVDTVAHTVTAQVEHFSSFGLGYNCSFTDVDLDDPNHWFAEAVYELCQDGILPSGVSNGGSYNPGTAATSHESLDMMLAAANQAPLTLAEQVVLAVIDDSPPDHIVTRREIMRGVAKIFYDYHGDDFVQKLKERGIINAQQDSLDENADRAQLAQLLYNARNNPPPLILLNVPEDKLLTQLMLLANSPKAENGNDNASHLEESKEYFAPIPNLVEDNHLFRSNAEFPGIYTYIGHYSKIWYCQREVSMGGYVARGVIDSKHTLIVATRQLDPGDGDGDAVDHKECQDDYYNYLKLLYDEAIEYQNAHGIEQAYFVGHSLGGGMTQRVMADYSARNDFKAVIFGSIGTHGPSGYDRRIVHLFHDDDWLMDGVGIDFGGDKRLVGTSIKIDHEDINGHGGHPGGRYVETVKDHLDAMQLNLLKDAFSETSQKNYYVKIGAIHDGADEVYKTDFYADKPTLEKSSRPEGIDRYYAVGGPENDFLSGTSGTDIIVGGAGSDRIYAGSGNGDELRGQSGSDVYEYWIGDGHDLIIDTGGNDVLELYPKPNSNFTTLDILFDIEGDNLRISFKDNTTDSVTIKNMLISTEYHVEKLSLYNDGPFLTTVGSPLPEPYYTEINLFDIISEFGNNVDENLHGSAPDDSNDTTTSEPDIQPNQNNETEYVTAIGGTCPAPGIYTADQWNYYKCECTSYVAWNLNKNGIPFTNQYKGQHWSNANTWQQAAIDSSVPVDNIPQVGDVAWWGTGTYGHVAYVESVNADGTVNISEYNFGLDHDYGTRNNITADAYIHVGSSSPSVPPPVPSPTNCSGDACNGLNPEATNCSTGAITAGGPNDIYATLNGVNQKVGTVELRWSSTCQTNWSRVIRTDGATGESVIARIIRDDGVQQFRELPLAPVSEWTDGQTRIWSPMLYAPANCSAYAQGMIDFSFTSSEFVIASQSGCSGNETPTTTPEPTPQPTPTIGASCDTGKVYDCAFNCVNATNTNDWQGDGGCDDGEYGLVLTCPAFNNDGGDCDAPAPTPSTPTAGASCSSDSVYDCDLKCLAEADVTAGKGDSYCDDGTYGMVLTCPAFNNDAGDCDSSSTPAPTPTSGCGTAEVEDCDGGCTSASWLGDGECDATLACSALNNDDGDCDSSSSGSSSGTCTPAVYSVSPRNAAFEQTTTFTISGNCLPDSTAFWIGECADLVYLGGDSQERYVECTPRYSTGVKEAVVKDEPNGNVLLDFAVTVY